MAYTPTEWKTGDVITADKLNNMEGGIVETIVPVTVNAEMDVVNGNAITVKDFDYAYSEVIGLIESGKRPVFFVNLDLVASGSVVAKHYLLFSNVIYEDNSQAQTNSIYAFYFRVDRNGNKYILPCFTLSFDANGMNIFTSNVTVSA